MLGDAGDALGDSHLRGEAVRARHGEEPRRRLHREGDARRAHASGSARTAEGGRARRRGRSVASSSATARRASSTTSTSTTPEPTDGETRRIRRELPRTTPRAVGDLRPTTRSPRSAAPRRPASTTSAAPARSASCPHFDDLLFLGASICRYPLEGYRESCGTDVVLGTRFAKKPITLKIPITIAGMSFGSLSANAKEALGPRRHARRHLDHHRRRRHDAGGARALEDRSSTSACPRATA